MKYVFHDDSEHLGSSTVGLPLYDEKPEVPLVLYSSRANAASGKLCTWWFHVAGICSGNLFLCLTFSAILLKIDGPMQVFHCIAVLNVFGR